VPGPLLLRVSLRLRLRLSLASARQKWLLVTPLLGSAFQLFCLAHLPGQYCRP
jgi:hypothetical protein